MRYSKKVVANMPLPYAIGTFDGPDAKSFAVGVEKNGPIRRFALDGTPMETVAEGPGGVMTIAQVPGRDDVLLATSEFFSPNFGGDTAGIVAYFRSPDGTWSSTRLCDLPYVHRFGVLEGADGRLWILACTIKSACRKVKNDWLSPGAVWAAPLNEALAEPGGRRLKLTEISGCQLQNHGFWVAPDLRSAFVTTAAGVFRYEPPRGEDETWQVKCLIVQPTSDVIPVDLDGDGTDELLTFSAFHGDTLSVWHQTEIEDVFELVWTDPKRRPFLHAIWGGELLGEPSAVVGNRQGGRDLLRVFYEEGSYQVEVIDHDHGPANCWVVRADNATRIVAANRETNEVALYDVTQ